MFIDVEIEEELDYVGNGHVVGVVDELGKKLRHAVYLVDCLLLSVV